MNQNPYSHLSINMALVLILALTAAACGYKFGNTRDSALPNISSLAVAPFRNSSFEEDAGDIFTRAARQVFAARGAFEMKSEDKASYVLKGRILSADSRTAVLKGNYGTVRSGIMNQIVEVELRLEDSTGTLIKECRIVDNTDSLGGEYPTDVGHNRRKAFEALAISMMQRAYNEIFEGF